MAEALYRKYRPQVFSDVVGQDHIERTIKNAIEADQVSHAYLFSGPRGTGKTTTARLLAKALLCEHGPTPEPDGTCRECCEIAEGVHPDVYELDAASRTGVDNVRDEIINRVNFAPTRGKAKVYIIDEVHMLSTAAFNALLKTLEEPPDHVVFILCTTDPQKVPDTIHSRCQRFEFHRLSNDEIVTRLGAICVAEGVEFDGDALDLIAHRAEGGMRNALTTLEQLIAFGEGHVSVEGAEDLLGALDTSEMAEIIRAVGQRDAAACFTWTANYVESGADLAQFAREMAEHVRNLYVMSLSSTDAVLDIPEAERRQLGEELALFGPERLARLLAVLGDLIAQLRTSSNPRLCFEIALTRMVRPDSDLTIEALAERVEALEAGSAINSGAVPLPQPAAAPAAPVAAPAAPAPTQAVPAPTPGASAVMSDAPSATPDVPAPQPASAAQGGLAALLANPAALQRTWMSVTSAIKKEKQAFAAMLVGVHAHPAPDGSGVIVEFPASNPISLSMAQKPDMYELLKSSFEAAAGFPVPFELVQGEESAAVETNTAVAVPPVAPVAAPPAVSDPASGTAPFVPDLPPEPEAFAAPVPEPAPAASEPTPEPTEPAPVPASAVPEPEPATPTPEGDSASATAQDLSKMFSETMGSSIVFEEVDE